MSGKTSEQGGDVIAALVAAMPQRGIVRLDHLFTDGRILRLVQIVRREVSP
jgi:hypothetical protein